MGCSVDKACYTFIHLIVRCQVHRFREQARSHSLSAFFQTERGHLWERACSRRTITRSS